MYTPASTYRIQFHKGFTFSDLEKQVDYLYELGISTIYASPVFKAAPGSTHGYDVTDPQKINPEIGTWDEFIQLCEKLAGKNIGWIQDIVPNHMAYHQDNYRLMDVLERGNNSGFQNFFDIDWQHPDPELNGKIMTPFLGKDLRQCLKENEIKLAFSKNGFSVRYYENEYPLSISAYPKLGNEIDLAWLKEDLDQLLQKAREAGFERWQTLKNSWTRAVLSDHQKSRDLKRGIQRMNDGKKALADLLEQQSYTLCYWKETGQKINYRRFFTINDLICVKVEDDAVFDESHKLIIELVKQGLIQGLRIDHIDGLKDPKTYLEKLRQVVGEDCYIIVEKILEQEEQIPKDWDIQGETGYRFLAGVNQLFTRKEGAERLSRFYRENMDARDYEQLVFENKQLILTQYMGGEWESLSRDFFNLNHSQKFDYTRIKQALKLLMCAMPVYRIYPQQILLPKEEQVYLKEAFSKARQQDTSCKAEFDYLGSLFFDENLKNEREVLNFLKRLMQFTGPLMAKGVEDTTFYNYNSLISHNEVGDSPAVLGISADDFHQQMKFRQHYFPLALNASATHDTKRGEDARMRINALTEDSETWLEVVKKWFDQNRAFRQNVNGRTIPDKKDEYFIYQALIGGCPQDFNFSKNWLKRFEDYLQKALREGKRNSNWETPDEAYEKGCSRFVEGILKSDTFRNSLNDISRYYREKGSFYSLGQTLLKLTAPGVPDMYQGCELWDLSFVDPDNRRPVDYELRKNILHKISAETNPENLSKLLEDHKEEGWQKFYLTYKVLNIRKENLELFSQGGYIPIQTKNAEVLAFARKWKEKSVLVIIPLKEGVSISLTNLQLPEDFLGKWRNVLITDKVDDENDNLLKGFPVGFLANWF